MYSSMVNMSRRSMINLKFSKLFSSELLQPENAKPLEPAQEERDKLYSRLEIELKGIEPEVMKSYAWFAVRAADHLGIKVGKW